MASTTEVSADIPAPLSPDELRKIDAYWHACNYLAAGMIYLRANPLLRDPLRPEHIKNRLLGHWGSDPGQSLIWIHLNRLIKTLRSLRLCPSYSVSSSDLVLVG
jgi:xylulose-5-phosphate/fructose-6-phosphate phosphoketolase